MKNPIIGAPLLILSLLEIGCAGPRFERHEYTNDPLYSAILRDDRLSEGSRVRFRTALVADRTFRVLDLENPSDESASGSSVVSPSEQSTARFGSELRPHEQCQTYMSGGGGYYSRCRLTLTWIDHQTREVLLSIEDIQQTENSADGPNWAPIIAKLTERAR
jgi:hypothetical protein